MDEIAKMEKNRLKWQRVATDMIDRLSDGVEGQERKEAKKSLQYANDMVRFLSDRIYDWKQQ
jgi:hypothetical protein